MASEFGRRRAALNAKANRRRAKRIKRSGGSRKVVKQINKVASEQEARSNSQSVISKSETVPTKSGPRDDVVAPPAEPTVVESRVVERSSLRDRVNDIFSRDQLITKTGASIGSVGKVKAGTVVEDERGRKGVVDDRGNIKFISSNNPNNSNEAKRNINNNRINNVSSGFNNNNGSRRNLARDNRSSNINTSSSIPGNDLVEKTQRKGKTFTEFLEQTNVGKAVTSGAINPIKSVVRGGVKAVELNPVIGPNINVARKIVGQKQKTQSEIIKDKDVQAFGITVGFFGLSAGLGSSSAIVRTTAKDVGSVATLGITGKQIATTIKDPSPENIGLSVASAIPAAVVVSRGARAASIRLGSKEVPPTDLFTRQNIANPQSFPTTTSTAAAQRSFSQANNVVQTSSPAPIKGNVAGVGRKASLGLEDPGIFVTPAGQGSSAFLRIPQQGGLTLNPFGSFRSRPTITQFETTGVSKLPRDVVRQPGFSAVKSFQESQAGSGKAFITKRSEIGQGEISRQPFRNPVTGKRSVEAGTTELEAVIPKGQTFTTATKTPLGRLKGFDSFTRINGELVPVRRVKLDVTNARTSVSRPVRGRSVSANRIRSETSSLSKVGSSRTSVTSPIGLASSVTSSRGSSRGNTSNTSRSVGPSSSSPTAIAGPASSISVPDSSSVSSSFFSGSSSANLNSSASSRSITQNSSTFSIQSAPEDSPISPSRPFSFRNRERRKKNSGFFVAQSRSRGQFRDIGRSQDLGTVAKLAATDVDTTSKASFRIIEERTGRIVGGNRLKNLLGGKFTGSTRERGVFLEKNKFRIDSGGEKSEITLKGILSNRLRL